MTCLFPPVYHSAQTTCVHPVLSYNAIIMFFQLYLKSAIHISSSDPFSTYFWVTFFPAMSTELPCSHCFILCRVVNFPEI